jgi:decaprenylphospho-beta-D-erythro-pentofuranosid-2-ulose 2-reductase
VQHAVLIVGPTSDIGRAIAQVLAAQGRSLILGGRDRDEMQRIASDLRVRHAVAVREEHFDALDFASHREFFARCCAGDELAGVIACHGYMVDQALADVDPAQASRTIDVNFKSYVSLLAHVAAHFEQRRAGFICALSSVAGDRGRQSNYTYGAAKAGLSAYLQGLRNRLAPLGVPVTTVKPGFVDTAMTWGLLKPGSPLVASPARVAHDIVRAIDRRRDVVYTPWFWRWIMLVIRSIPEAVFKRLRL